MLRHGTWHSYDFLSFPIYLYEPLPARMRLLMTPSHVMQLTSEARRPSLANTVGSRPESSIITDPMMP